MKGYVLKGEDRSRDALEAKGRVGVQKEIKGITMDFETAEAWEESKRHRSYEEHPEIEMQKVTAYDFRRKKE